MLDLGVLGFYIFMISFVSVFFFGRWLFVLLYSKRWSNPDGFIDEFITYRHDVLVKSLRRIPTFLGCLEDWKAELFLDGEEYVVRTRDGMLSDDDYSLDVRLAYYKLRDRIRDGKNTPVTLLYSPLNSIKS